MKGNLILGKEEIHKLQNNKGCRDKLSTIFHKMVDLLSYRQFPLF